MTFKFDRVEHHCTFLAYLDEAAISVIQQNQVMDSYMTSMSALKVPKRAVQRGSSQMVREIR